MIKINFKNGEAPYINDTNLNLMQDNIEEAIDKKSSLPSGGNTGQVLMKNSNTDEDTKWEDIPSQLPTRRHNRTNTSKSK